MFRTLIPILIIIQPFAQVVHAQSVSELEADLERMMTWFPGHYDNHRQVYQQFVENVSSERRHRQTHHIFHPVSVSGIPSPQIYAEQSEHYDRNNIYRQRIYSFSIDTDRKRIRLTIYTPKAASKLTGAHKDPSILNDLRADDFILKLGCDVFWSFEGGEFRGYLEEDACSYYSTSF